jgi:hypothetical protein
MKRFLIFVFLFLFIGGSSGKEIKNFSFESQAQTLSREVYPKIKTYLKTVDLYPYNQEKGNILISNVLEIILTNNNLFISSLPVIELYGIEDEKNVYFRLSVIIAVFDNEKIPGMNPSLVFGKVFFIKSYKKITKPSGKKFSL